MSPRRPRGKRFDGKWVELLVFYFALPVALCGVRGPFGRILIPFLGVLALAFVAALVRDHAFENRRLYRLEGLGRTVALALAKLVAGGSVLTVLVLWLRPELFLLFARERTGFWLLVLHLYPIFSAYPQEVIFRAFPFHRYRHLFTADWQLVCVMAVSFALAHLFLWNWIAPSLSLLGGLLFGATYVRTRSTVHAALEHGLWGGFLFTLGLGPYFYGGHL